MDAMHICHNETKVLIYKSLLRLVFRYGWRDSAILLSYPEDTRVRQPSWRYLSQNSRYVLHVDLYFVWRILLEYDDVVSCFLQKKLLTDMERAIIRDLLSHTLLFSAHLLKAVNFVAELDWYLIF